MREDVSVALEDSVDLENSVGLDVSLFEAVAESGTIVERLALARQISQLFCDPQSDPGEIDQVRPVLCQLMADDDAEVRRTVAERLAPLRRNEPELAFAIAADDDDIALPFIARARLVTGEQLLTILRVGDEARQNVVAMRPDLDMAIVTHILAECPVDVCSTLLANAHVKLSEQQHSALFQRFAKDGDFTEKLLQLPDFPIELRIAEARRSAKRMRKLLAEKSWLATGEASDLCADAEDMAVIDLLATAPESTRARAMAYMAAKNFLTPGFLVRAAAQGRMEAVEAAIAHLANITPATVAAQMYNAHGAHFKALFRRSGLPQNCFGVLRAACDVVIELSETGHEAGAAEFGQLLTEALMMRYEDMDAADRAKQLEYLSRFADAEVRPMAKRLKQDLLRAA